MTEQGVFTYIVGHEAWYWKSIVEHTKLTYEIMIQKRPANREEGGVFYEFGIRWHKLNGQDVPKLEIFEDAFVALTEFREFFDELAKMHSKNPTPEQIQLLLARLKCVDETSRKSPYEEAAA